MAVLRFFDMQLDTFFFSHVALALYVLLEYLTPPRTSLDQTNLPSWISFRFSMTLFDPLNPVYVKTRIKLPFGPQMRGATAH